MNISIYLPEAESTEYLLGQHCERISFNGKYIQGFHATARMPKIIWTKTFTQTIISNLFASQRVTPALHMNVGQVYAN